MASYGHAMDAFFCAAFLATWAATIGRRDALRYVWLGLLLGLAALIRTQELAMGVALVVEMVLRLGELARDRARPARDRMRDALAELGRGALTLGVAAVAFTPQLAMWKTVYGAYHLPHGDAYTRWGSPMIPELLFGARNGWFPTTPVAYLAVLGLALLPRRAAALGLGLVAVVATQVYLNSIIMDWWGQSSFGARRLCSVTFALVIGLTALFARGAALVARMRRLPPWSGHVLAAAVLLPCLRWNLRSASALRGSKAASTLHAPSCCANFPLAWQPVIAPAYALLGNPFSLPASAVFAARHRTSLSRWDRVVGDYPIILDGNMMVAGTWRQQRGSWNLGAESGEPYVLEGLGPTQVAAGRLFRRTTAPRARAFVPNLIPAAQRYEVWLRPPASPSQVRLFFEGSLVADVGLVPGWQAVGFDVARPPTGSNELWIEADAGIDVSAVDVSFLPVFRP